MKLHNLLLIVLALTGLGLFAAQPARADGIIVPPLPPCDPCPPPPCPGPLPCPIPSPMVQLVIRHHKVDVTIEDQVAITHVDQVFYNPNDWTVEGTYLFPLPKDAAVSSFTLWIDGEPVEGEILDAEQARQTYREIVSTLRDPALLEYADRGAVQAHIFPIPPQGERRIELEYTQALAAENGLVRYVYPLNTEKFSLLPLEEVVVNVDVRSQVPIRALYSPSHAVAIHQEDDQHARVGYEAQNLLPDSDFTLYYSIGEAQAFHLLTYRDPAGADSLNGGADGDGFFLLLLAPSPEAGVQTLPKDVILVLDQSGSMEGEKFTQAQAALRYILGHLNPEDNFNVIAFSTGLESYASSLRPAAEASAALDWVDRLGAAGSTDINRALLEAAAMVNSERPAYLIFLTDGLPTEGVVDSPQILQNFARQAPANLRLFAFGVGYDVDTYLLDSLSQAHHGSSTYVLPGERLDEILSGFYARISTPVLTDLELDFGDVPVYDLYPSPLPDLFKGSQIILAGRYRQGGTAAVRLTGTVNGQEQTFTFPEQFFPTSTGSEGAQAAIPRLWATRKIGHLLSQVRLNGPDQELIDQIVRLSIRYGIVTPYTSYLVTEPMPLGAAEQDRIAGEQFSQMQTEAPAPAFGQEAVEKAAGQRSLADAGAPVVQSSEAAGRVRIVGARTFVLSQGKWIDTAFDPDVMQAIPVSFLSEEYFQLVEARPDLAAAFALGEQVIALADGQAYEVVPAGTDTGPVPLPQSQATVVQNPQPTPATPAPAPDSPPPASSSRCLGGLAPLALVGLWLALRPRRG